MVYRALQWPYFLPPINDQYNQESWSYMCNIPILQRSYSLWPLKHTTHVFIHQTMHGYKLIRKINVISCGCTPTSYIHLKCLRTFVPPMHHTSSKYGGLNYNISKHPWCPHTSNTCQPNYSPQDKILQMLTSTKSRQ